jgi:protein gp37
MSETKIQWTERTWNPIAGCDIVSPGCKNCYAMRDAHRLAHNPHPKIAAKYAGTTKTVKGKPVWTGVINPADEHTLTLPLRTRKPTMWFVNSMSDLFHENVADEVIDRIFAIMALTPQHTFQVLTKRSARMRDYMSGTDAPCRIYDIVCDMVICDELPVVLSVPGVEDPGLKPAWPRVRLGAWPLPNVWLGVSVEDQTRADERIPDLLATPAAIRFISAEPLLGPVDLGTAWHGESALDSECWGECAWCDKGYPPLHNCQRGEQTEADVRKWRSGLDWVIVGGESGSGARPMHPDWATDIRDQCASAGVPFFFKQWGDWELALDRDHDDPDWRRDYTNDFADEGKSRWLNFEGGRGFHGERFCVMRNVGTKRAGRRLDGIEHNAMPAAALPPVPHDLASGEIG